MKKLRRANFINQPRARAALFAVGGLVLIGGSFSIASGTIIDKGSSLYAAAAAAITGKPTVLIGLAATSPANRIPMGKSDALATYDVKVKNVSHWASMKTISINVSISSATAAPLSLKDIYLSYYYCIPTGATYGYGYVSKGCATIKVAPTAVSKDNKNYIVNFGGAIPVYPQETVGKFTIYATPMYPYTGAKQVATAVDARLRVKITGATASGDQCLWSLNPGTNKYAYTGCVSYSAIVNVYAPYGNQLTATRSYGYGYAVKK